MKASLSKTTVLTGLLRLGIRFSVFLAACAIAFTATLYSFEYYPPKVTVCQLAGNPEFYRGRLVTIEAEALGRYGIVIEDGACKAPDAWVAVWPAEGYESGPEVQKMYSENVTDLKFTYKARVRVTGRFDPDATPGCFAPKAAFRATSIELTSPVTTEPIPERNIAGD